MLLKLEDWIRTFSHFLGNVAGILFILLLFNVFYDVIARYVFNSVSIGMQEMEWHLYASMCLLGVSYGIATEGHVRVDLVYDRLSPSRRAIIDLTVSHVLLMPFALMVFWLSLIHI